MNKKAKKKSSVGLKRYIKQLFQKIKLVILFIAVIFICMFMIFGKSMSIYHNIRESLFEISIQNGFTIKNLIISSLKNLTKEEIIDAVDINYNSSIFSIDLESIKRNIEKIDWVESCIVERKLPNSIYIAVLERKPIAIWQNDYKLYVVDKHKHTISIENSKNFGNLIFIIGNDAYLHVQDLLNIVNSDRKLMNNIITASRLGERRWNLNFIENVTVKMPEKNFNLAWNFLVKLNSQNKLFGQNIKTIDLRDNNKIYFEKY